MSVNQAKEFFDTPEIERALIQMDDVGIGYITLGQALNTLSGGERQRIKLALQLQKHGGLYILDEPTTGLHMSDVNGLIDTLNRMVDNGNTVIVIEHNLDVIAQADWVIDIGPGAGEDGGLVIFEGTPAQMASDRRSVTGKYLS